MCVVCEWSDIQHFADSQDVSRRKKAEVSEVKYMTNETGTTHLGAADGTDDDDQPLSTWFGGIQGPANVSELSKLLTLQIFNAILTSHVFSLTISDLLCRTISC